MYDNGQIPRLNSFLILIVTIKSKNNFFFMIFQSIMSFTWIHEKLEHFSGSISYSAILTPINFPLVWLLSTCRPHRKSAYILAHFLPTSEASALFLFCAYVTVDLSAERCVACRLRPLASVH
jgi:hypothetical protein